MGSTKSQFDCRAETATPDRSANSVSEALFDACYAGTNNRLTVTVLKPGVDPKIDHKQVAPGTDPALQAYMGARDSVVKIEMKDAQGKTTERGSGFFVSQDGKIGTAIHVISDGGQAVITTTDGKQHNAHVLDVDQKNEAALLQVDRESPMETFKAIPLRNIPAQRDEPVMGLGHPDGAPQVVASPGIVQGYVEFTDVFRKGADNEIPAGMDTHRQLISSNMNTRVGGSGGPVIDLQGSAVGYTDLEGGNATPIGPIQGLLKKHE
jgi:S1-C subfamily serine protease